MLANVANLSELYLNTPYGLDEGALVWATIISIVMYAGPAIVALVYLLMREKEPAIGAGSPEQHPEELLEERRDKAA